MEKLTQEELLSSIFRTNDRVEVNATELQNLLITNNNTILRLANKVKILERDNDILERKVDNLQNTLLENDTRFYLDLKC